MLMLCSCGSSTLHQKLQHLDGVQHYQHDERGGGSTCLFCPHTHPPHARFTLTKEAAGHDPACNHATSKALFISSVPAATL